MLPILSCVFVIVFLLLFKWFKDIYNYWKDRCVPTTDFEYGWGHMKMVLFQKETIGAVINRAYGQLKPLGAKYFGIYSFVRPMLVAVDLRIVKSVMQSDFEHFNERGNYFNEKNDPLSAHLFNLGGEKWKNLRVKLTPTFTTGKMKMMLDDIVDCAKEFEKAVCKATDGPIHMNNFTDRFTINVISKCAFGIEVNAFGDSKCEFLEKAKTVFQRNSWDSVISFVTTNFPSLSRKLGLKVLHSDVTEFYANVVKSTIDYREKNNVSRKDFMHLLLQLKNRGKLVDDESVIDKNNENVKGTLTVNEIAAQAFIFFEAGYETSSSTISNCLFELGLNENIQNTLRKEIQTVLERYDGKITYEAISEMVYLESCVNETLRKYPVLPIVFRTCVNDFKLPDTDFYVEKGIRVMIPIYAIHHDSEYYPDPEKFDPNRFCEEEKRSRPTFSYLPFGEGPRICIGMRFGKMQAKVGLITILRDYIVKTKPECLPFEIDPTSVTLKSKKGVWLDCKKIK